MTKIKNITHVVERNLCTSCGACFAVCKTGAIVFKETTAGNYFPVIDGDLCIHCALCCSVCTGEHFSDTLKEKMPEDPFIGRCIQSFVGKATNKEIFENSQSGGIVSALAVHAMDSGLADAAVTVVMEWGNPPRPKACLARSVDEITLAQRSKYCPVPTLSLFKDVIDSDQRIVFVGTPCQVHGLYNLMNIVPKLRKNIVLVVGLVCDRVMTYGAMDYLIKKSGIGEERSQSLIFRDKTCEGYPGIVHIQSQDGQSKVEPAVVRMQIKDYFTPARCRICFDKMNIFADVTIGDPHGLENVDRKRGESMLVVRTKNGQNIVQSAQRDNAINVRPVTYKKIIEGQHIDDKKVLWSCYTHAWKMSGRPFPDYYERIKKHAPDPSVDKKTIQSMNYALQLDDFDSRNALIVYVQNALEKKLMLQKFLFPLRVVKRFMMKIRSVLG